MSRIGECEHSITLAGAKCPRCPVPEPLYKSDPYILANFMAFGRMVTPTPLEINALRSAAWDHFRVEESRVEAENARIDLENRLAIADPQRYQAYKKSQRESLDLDEGEEPTSIKWTTPQSTEELEELMGLLKEEEKEVLDDDDDAEADDSLFGWLTSEELDQLNE